MGSNNLLSEIRRRGMPVSATLIALCTTVFLTDFFSRFGLGPWLMLSKDPLRTPWQIITFPFAGREIVGLLFLSLMLYFIGSSLEPDLGSKRFAQFFVVCTLVSGAVYFIALAIFGTPGPVQYNYLPFECIFLAFCGRNPEAEILVYFFRVKAKYLAYALLAIAFFTVGAGSIPLALLALIPLLGAWFFGMGKLPIPFKERYKPTKAETQKHNEFEEEVFRKRKEREEREKLRKLFESSLKDDPDENAK